MKRTDWLLRLGVISLGTVLAAVAALGLPAIAGAAGPEDESRTGTDREDRAREEHRNSHANESSAEQGRSEQRGDSSAGKDDHRPPAVGNTGPSTAATERALRAQAGSASGRDTTTEHALPVQADAPNRRKSGNTDHSGDATSNPKSSATGGDSQAGSYARSGDSSPAIGIVFAPHGDANADVRSRDTGDANATSNASDTGDATATSTGTATSGDTGNSKATANQASVSQAETDDAGDSSASGDANSNPKDGSDTFTGGSAVIGDCCSGSDIEWSFSGDDHSVDGGEHSLDQYSINELRSTDVPTATNARAAPLTEMPVGSADSLPDAPSRLAFTGGELRQPSQPVVPLPDEQIFLEPPAAGTPLDSLWVQLAGILIACSLIVLVPEIFKKT